MPWTAAAWLTEVVRSAEPLEGANQRGLHWKLDPEVRSQIGPLPEAQDDLQELVGDPLPCR